jgi:hypothetical protein
MPHLYDKNKRVARGAGNPTYHHNGKTVLPGPGNPVGTRWMGLSITGYGIHGTNKPKSISKAASHGCIRMATMALSPLLTTSERASSSIRLNWKAIQAFNFLGS